MKLINKILISFLAIFIFLSFSVFVFADDNNDDKLQELTSKIEEYEKTIKELKGQQQTLKSTISFLNNKISLTQAQVSKTEKEIEILEKEIDKLSVKIVILDRTLNDISKILSSRITATYKSSYIKPAYLLFSTSDFSSLLSKIKYLKVAQAHDHSLMMQMEKQKKNYDDQKDLKEEKQAEMEKLKQTLKVQTAVLAQQQQSKQVILEETKSSEKEFQSLLQAARAEFQSIQAIIAGKGEETEIGLVKEGDKIATLKTENLCNSSGSHLHFMVAKDGNAQNPFSYLGSIDHRNCSSCYSSQSCPCPDADPFNPGGNWRWPMDGPITLSQGWGSTWAVNNIAWLRNIYDFHNGIDFDGSSSNVYAVKEGTLYRGSYKVGCNLQYVRVEHKDGGYDTYYLHVNYF